MGLKAIVFDVDGTLSETEENHREAFNRAFAESGLDWHWDRRRYAELLQVTGGKERIAHYIRQYHPERVAEIIETDRLLDIHGIKNAAYGELTRGARPLKLRPGIARLVREAHGKGVKLGIATTTTVQAIEALLDTNLGAGSITLFDAITAGDMARRKKPAPDVYTLALGMLDVAPDQAIAIEDSAVGLQSARAAGLAVVVTPSVYTKGEDFAGALSVVSSLGEPDAPATRISGARLRGDVVDIAQLTTWLQSTSHSDGVAAASG